jgi:hypothetical protein
MTADGIYGIELTESLKKLITEDDEDFDNKWLDLVRK